MSTPAIPPPPRKPDSLRPSTPVSLSLGQVIGYGIALTAFGTTVGAIYPRLLAMETTVAKIQEAQDNTVRSVERLAVIVERMDKGR